MTEKYFCPPTDWYTTLHVHITCPALYCTYVREDSNSGSFAHMNNQRCCLQKDQTNVNNIRSVLVLTL